MKWLAFRLLFVSILSVGVVSSINCESEQPPTSKYVEISINSTAHEDYGLGYPVTYEFSIPAGLSQAKAYHEHALQDSWEQLTEKTSNDFFNGIECVRFDFISRHAFVSVAFDGSSDDIFIQVTDSGGWLQYINFIKICPYYDNRKCAITATGDTDYVSQAALDAWCDAYQSRHIWASVAMITSLGGSSIDWNALNSQLAQGYLEVVSHSRTHPYVPFADYDSEVNGSKQDIVNNLDLPSFQKKGSSEYVVGWVEPYGLSDSAERAKLGQYKYLCDRDVTRDDSWAAWDATNGLYERIGTSAQTEVDSLTKMESKFDSVYSSGGIFHIWGHVQSGDYSSTGKFCQILDYIKDKKDCWYVPFGAMYMYHYCQERGEISIQKSS